MLVFLRRVRSRSYITSCTCIHTLMPTDIDCACHQDQIMGNPLWSVERLPLQIHIT